MDYQNLRDMHDFEDNEIFKVSDSFNGMKDPQKCVPEEASPDESSASFQSMTDRKCFCSHTDSSPTLRSGHVPRACNLIMGQRLASLTLFSIRRTTSLSRSRGCRICRPPSHIYTKSSPGWALLSDETRNDPVISRTTTRRNSLFIIYVSFVLCFLRVSWGLRTGRYPPYDGLCRGATSQRIPVIWDCTGFVQVNIQH